MSENMVRIQKATIHILTRRLEEAVAEVEKLRKKLDKVTKECGALWSITENWSLCEDDYTMHDQYESLDERYAEASWGIILKELYTYTEEDGWQLKEMSEHGE